MSRVKRGTISMKHRRNVLKEAKGYRFGRSKKEIEAKVALRHAGAHAFAHRKDKKTDARRLFTVRLNAALRPLGMNYSRFIDGMKKKGMEVDRKVLSQIAKENNESFVRIVEQVKA
jgi:large subunit ribosomal protein L20